MGQAAEKEIADQPVNRSRHLYVVKQAERRREKRAHVHVRVVHPISTPQLIRDPLVRHTNPLRSTVTGTQVLIAAMFLHGAALLVFLFLSRFMSQPGALAPSTAVEVQINDVPPPPPLQEEEEEPLEEGPVADDFEEPTPPEEEPPPRKEPQAPASPQPDASVEELPEDSPPPPRRIVGLSFESTVEGGSGPAFATGTSRMGRTERRASAPETARKKPTGETKPSTGSTREQRAATHIPTQGGKLAKPRRMTPRKPPFPATLRAQGIEGDVLVRVKIAASGAVTDVAILKSSGHAAFDQAARKAALSETFAPATRNGKPIPFTLSYSYRFRIED